MEPFGRQFLLLGARTCIWTGETFSMNARNQAIAISVQPQIVANAVLQQVFPLYLTQEGASISTGLTVPIEEQRVSFDAGTGF